MQSHCSDLGMLTLERWGKKCELPLRLNSSYLALGYVLPFAYSVLHPPSLLPVLLHFQVLTFLFQFDYPNLFNWILSEFDITTENEEKAYLHLV